MKKLFVVFSIMLVMGHFLNLHAQIVTDTLTLTWEPSVWYGAYGQRTVVINDTLYHLGGNFAYGVPYGDSYYDHSFIEFKAPSNNYWLVQDAKLIGRSYINAEAYNSKIYVFGGEQRENDYPAEVEIYDTHLKSVTYGSSCPAPRARAGSALANGKIYIIGGRNQNGYSDKVDIYDIATDMWSSGTPLPIATETEACYYDGKIYVIGGYSGFVHDEIYEYDIATNTWTLIGHAPYPVSAHKLAVYQDYIYVVGDYSEIDRIMRYCVTDSSWTVYSSNVIGRRHASTAIIGEKLYIIAGVSKHDDVFQYYRIVQSIDLSKATTLEHKTILTPYKLKLSQNYPNPFNIETNIFYQLTRHAFVELSIYNSLGKKIRTLLKNDQSAGNYKIRWNGTDDKGNLVSTGLYIYKLKIDGAVQARKMLLLK